MFKFVNETLPSLNMLFEIAEVNFRNIFFLKKTITDVDIRSGSWIADVDIRFTCFELSFLDVAIKLDITDVDIRFSCFELSFPDVAIKLDHYRCRHSVQAIELWMATSGSHFLNFLLRMLQVNWNITDVDIWFK